MVKTQNQFSEVEQCHSLSALQQLFLNTLSLQEQTTVRAFSIQLCIHMHMKTKVIAELRCRIEHCIATKPAFYRQITSVKINADGGA